MILCDTPHFAQEGLNFICCYAIPPTLHKGADEGSLEPATSSLCWGEHFGLVPSNTVQVCTNLSLLCVKGGGLCAAKLGGIVSRYFHFANTSYRWLYNPPVSATQIQPPLLGGTFLFECITPPPDGATQWIHREPSRLHAHKTDCASSSACATTWCIS